MFFDQGIATINDSLTAGSWPHGMLDSTVLTFHFQLGMTMLHGQGIGKSPCMRSPLFFAIHGPREGLVEDNRTSTNRWKISRDSNKIRNTMQLTVRPFFDYL